MPRKEEQGERESEGTGALYRGRGKTALGRWTRSKKQETKRDKMRENKNKMRGLRKRRLARISMDIIEIESDVGCAWDGET